MRRADDAPLVDMLLYARRIQSRAESLSRAEFDADDDLQLALVHLIQVIGEAARQVDQARVAAHPEIPWRDIVGMRHRIVHDYQRIDLDVVWDTATNSIPQLIAVLERALSESSAAEPPEEPQPE